jgi:hypothetical protein
VTCKEHTEVRGFGWVGCCLVAPHGDTPHRWQGQTDGVGMAVEWHTRRAPFRDSSLNGIRVAAQKPDATDEEIALALLGYLADRPGVARLLLADLPAVVG